MHFIIHEEEKRNKASCSETTSSEERNGGIPMIFFLGFTLIHYRNFRRHHLPLQHRRHRRRRNCHCPFSLLFLTAVV